MDITRKIALSFDEDEANLVCLAFQLFAYIESMGGLDPDYLNDTDRELIREISQQLSDNISDEYPPIVDVLDNALVAAQDVILVRRGKGKNVPGA